MNDDILDDETVERAAKLIVEALKAVDQIRALFPDTTRGMMVFMYAMEIIKNEYPVIEDIKPRLAEWIAAGEPEDVTQVVPIILEKRARMRKEPVN